MVKMRMFERDHPKKPIKNQVSFLKNFFTTSFKKNSKVISIKILVNMLDNPLSLQLNLE
jgi:hypothetical protein